MNEEQIRGQEFLAGQIDALRTAVIALAVLSGNTKRFPPVFQSLQKNLQDRLLDKPISEAQLNGIACETDAILQLLQPI